MKKNRVIICGYEKSGNTWLTRLTAEIVRCPVIGFWCHPTFDEIGIEGQDRVSSYQCFKAHHTSEQLQITLDLYGNGSEKIIYIYRDPRSVVVSAANYFNVQPRYPSIYSILCGLHFGLGFYHKFFQPKHYQYDVYIDQLIHGTPVSIWRSEPWENHVKGYLKRTDILLVSYESLRNDTLVCARKIADFLSLERSTAELKQAIEVQSFVRKKKQFEEQGETLKASFLREGSVSSWKSELESRQINYIEQNLEPLMTRLGYELDTIAK